MKADIIVPTVPYGNITYHVKGEPEWINEQATYFLSLRKSGEGLPTKEWNEWLDIYLTDNTGSLDQYARMSEVQQAIVQEIKKCIKRINK